jgi:apolipoprotein N-acyltransferase
MSRATELSHGFAPITWRRAGVLGLLGVACFHAAYTPEKSGPLALLIIGYVVCLVQLARLPTTRQCFYTGLGVSFACFAPQLECFWRIFGAGAIALWLILSLWIGLFVALAHLALARLGLKWAALLIPFLWTGLEYFRSELYYLRFSWLTAGFVVADLSWAPLGLLGVYGIGFVVLAYASLFLVVPVRQVLLYTVICLTLLLLLPLLVFGTAKIKMPPPNLIVAGVQLEFPDERQIIQALDRILVTQPNLPLRTPRSPTNVDLVVLSEYTLDAPPTEPLKEWCRANQKFLIVGGKDPALGNDYYNTAFVISTNGEVVFKQVQGVPIQFFRDGLPAPEQKLWESPWGKIGICICYDLSYARVTDELIRQGAQMLIVPTMDVVDWGRHQHELHARVAPVRAAEYGIPIFRLASSGISQGVSSWRWQNVDAPFPGEGEMIFFGPTINRAGSLPVDRWLAPLCVGVTGLFVIWLAVESFRRKRATGSKGYPA